MLATAGTYALTYDCNGNVIKRTVGSSVHTLTVNVENQQTAVSGAATAGFAYDGDSQRVLGTAGGVTTTYIGNNYERHTSTGAARLYYDARFQQVAVLRPGGTGTPCLLTVNRTIAAQTEQLLGIL